MFQMWYKSGWHNKNHNSWWSIYFSFPYDGMTDPLIRARWSHIYPGLTRYGYRFTILSCDKPEKYANRNYVEELAPWSFYKNGSAFPITKSACTFIDIWLPEAEGKGKGNIPDRSFDMVTHTALGCLTLCSCGWRKKYAVKFLDDVKRGF